MALTTGARLGSYEIVSALGAGGMGEVYRATDLKLKRQVAIKILPSLLEADLDALARFQREAELLASLNHPHIAAIYGLEDAGDARALVMELVEGEELAQRIARGPIPLDEALPIAKQIADALEAAHDLGIIHRDLKPANVKVRDDGTVKVLDFGLAKALDPASASNANAMNSPTLTARATQLGVILGTAAYMSPEQARGRTVDKRTDIWAFGVVLYEMLTGQRAFRGDDISETLASVLKDTPSLDALPDSTPLRLKRLLERCLERDPKTRLRDIGEARVEIARVEAGAADTSVVSARSVARPSVVARIVPWALAALFGVGLGVALLTWSRSQVERSPGLRKLLTAIGADASLPTGLGASAILSPDGTTLAFVGQQAGSRRLFVRKLDRLDAVVLDGTEGAANPFFKADGQWLAFFAGGELRKVAVTGGPVVRLCKAPLDRGGTWADDGTIIFSTSAGVFDGTLMRVSEAGEAGGAPVVLVKVSQRGAAPRWPQALPGGRGVLYTRSTSPDDSVIEVAPLSDETPKVVVPGGYFGRYVPRGLGARTQAGREDGHLVYMQEGTLFAVPFDLDRLEATGQAMPVLDGIATNRILLSAQVAVSSEGTLAYVPGGLETAVNPIDWMTSDGKTSVLDATKVAWGNPRFSPDGSKLAVEISDGKQRDIWVYQWASGQRTQVTFDSHEDRTPVWTSDGGRIVFSSDRAKPGIFNLYWVNADGTGKPEPLLESSENQLAASWHPTKGFLAFQAERAGTGWDLMILPMEGSARRGWTPAAQPTAFLALPGLERAPMFSPDGSWIAYVSNENGGLDVHVRPFPGPGNPRRISTEGGVMPRWSGSQLLFLDSVQRKVMFATYSAAGEMFRADKPRIWSPTSYMRTEGLNTYPYDVHPDGKRLVLASARQENVELLDHFVLVSNLFDDLH